MSKQDDSGISMPERLGRLAAKLISSPLSSVLVALVSLFTSLYELVANYLFDDVVRPLMWFTLVFVLGYFALNIFTSRYASFAMRYWGLYKVVAKLNTLGKEQAVKELAISVSYLESVKSNNLRAKIALVLSSVVFLFGLLKFPELQISELAFICPAVLALLYLKEALLEYRIRHGLFGATRTEAQELIEFLIKNSEDIDFSNGGGGFRSVLLPRAERSVGRHSRPAQDGATA